MFRHSSLTVAGKHSSFHVCLQASLAEESSGVTVVQLPGQTVQIQGVIQAPQASVIQSPQVQTVQVRAHACLRTHLNSFNG